MDAQLENAIAHRLNISHQTAFQSFDPGHDHAAYRLILQGFVAIRKAEQGRGILEEHGIEVYLVNARDTRNLPGRKTDVQESQWLLKLHTYGLLRNSFRPASEIRVLRAYWRQRDQHVKTAGQCVQRIQKALTQMNLQLANVISDLSGKTGLQILRAVVNGERDPAKLADFRDPRIKASREDIIASLRGNWRAELLFQVKQELARYDFCQTQIEECDGELEQQLQSLPELRAGEEKSGTKETQRPPKKRKRRKDGNIPRFDLHHELQRISGVDLTRIDGIDVMTGQTVISEVGLDMSRWPSENHFASWLGLCPSNELSGGRILKKRTRKAWELAQPSRDRDWPLQPPVPRKTQNRRYRHPAPPSQSLEPSRKQRPDHNQMEVHKKDRTPETKLLIHAATVLV